MCRPHPVTKPIEGTEGESEGGRGREGGWEGGREGEGGRLTFNSGCFVVRANAWRERNAMILVLC